MTTNKQTQQKFLVISYDDDQQQWFYDFVIAASEQAAVDRLHAALLCDRRRCAVAREPQ